MERYYETSQISTAFDGKTSDLALQLPKKLGRIKGIKNERNFKGNNR